MYLRVKFMHLKHRHFEGAKSTKLFYIINMILFCFWIWIARFFMWVRVLQHIRTYIHAHTLTDTHGHKQTKNATQFD